MTSRIEKLQLGTPSRIFQTLGLMTLGSVLCAVAIKGILMPYGFLSAGFMGITLGIHYLLPWLSVSAIYFLLNVPVFALGWKYVGKRFFLFSIAGMFIFSAALQWTDLSIPVRDKILAAFLAGLIGGAGAGIILRSLGSAGGLDILAVILLQRFSISLGATSLVFNSLILAVGAVVFSVDLALYTLIFIYVNAKIMNLVVTGLSQRKAVFIISRHWQEIAQTIFERINRGVTVIKGQGGYTRQEQEILYTVITFRELVRLKNIIREVDPDAFMVVTATVEVMGHRIGNQPHW